MADYDERSCSTRVTIGLNAKSRRDLAIEGNLDRSLADWTRRWSSIQFGCRVILRGDSRRQRGDLERAIADITKPSSDLDAVAPLPGGAGPYGLGTEISARADTRKR